MTKKEFTQKYVTLEGIPIIVGYLMADPKFEEAFKEASVAWEVADIAVQKQIIAEREAKVAAEVKVPTK